MDSRTKNKAAFSNSSGRVWTAGVLVTQRLEERLAAVMCSPVRIAGSGS